MYTSFCLCISLSDNTGSINIAFRFNDEPTLFLSYFKSDYATRTIQQKPEGKFSYMAH